jgi:hypothetical protein
MNFRQIDQSPKTFIWIDVSPSSVHGNLPEKGLTVSCCPESIFALPRRT